MSDYTTITHCRVCENNRLEEVFSLGHQPLANAFVHPSDHGQDEFKIPLTVLFCPDCSLVQLAETVPPAKLFSDYVYLSSMSPTMMASCSALVKDIIKKYKINNKSFIVEIASNDGYLLSNYVADGIPVLGVEPASGIADIARSKGIPTMATFFDHHRAQDIVATHGRAHVIHAHNVLAHVPNIHSFLMGVKTLLDPQGVFVIEVPSVMHLIDQGAFDTIYHEHIFYFSLTSLSKILKHHGLMIDDAVSIPLHGGSLRLFVHHAAYKTMDDPHPMMMHEDTKGINQVSYYRQLTSKAASLKTTLLDLIHGLRAKGSRIGAYGASAKGTVLLNFLNLGHDDIHVVVDKNPKKQGFLTPGTHIPICDISALADYHLDYTLLLTWNFRDEIMAEQHAYLGSGGQFIVPLPDVMVVGEGHHRQEPSP